MSLNLHLKSKPGRASRYVAALYCKVATCWDPHNICLVSSRRCKAGNQAVQQLMYCAGPVFLRSVRSSFCMLAASKQCCVSSRSFESIISKCKVEMRLLDFQ